MRAETRPDFFFIWSGDRFSLLFRIAVSLVSCHHPDARVVVYVVGPSPTSVHFQALLEDGTAEVVALDPAEVLGRLPLALSGAADVYSRLPRASHAARSNILRYALLHDHGGVYLDTDVLTVARFPDLDGVDAAIGLETVWSGDRRRVSGDRTVWMSPTTCAWALAYSAVRCDSLLASGRLGVAGRIDRFGHAWTELQANNAVLASSPRSQFIAEVLAGIGEVDSAIRYSTGPTLVHDVLSGTNANVRVFGPDVFYSIPPGQSFRLFEDVTFRLPDSAVAVHVAASNHETRVARMSATDPCARPGTVIHGLMDADAGMQQGKGRVTAG
jgi:hypothetical protein